MSRFFSEVVFYIGILFIFFILAAIRYSILHPQVFCIPIPFLLSLIFPSHFLQITRSRYIWHILVIQQRVEMFCRLVVCSILCRRLVHCARAGEQTVAVFGYVPPDPAIAWMLLNEVDVIPLEGDTGACEMPVNKAKELELEGIKFLGGDATNLGVMGVCAVRIAQSLG